MKLRHLLFGVLAGVAFVACTNDNEPAGVTPVNGAEEVAANKSFMKINFVMPGGADTRAGETFEVGTDAENQVDKGVLFFFDGNTQVADPFELGAEGSAALEGTTLNWTDQTGNIVEKSSIIIVLSNPLKDPKSVVAVLNANLADLGLSKSSTLEEIKAKTDNYAAASKIGAGKFVMSSSAYNEAVGKIAAEVKEVYKTVEAAKASPSVVIPVERVVAKVTVDASKAKMNMANAETGKESNTVTINGKEVEITADVKGWWLDNAPSRSLLLKDITGMAAADNDKANMRSYWAKPNTGTLQHGAWANATTADKYVQENVNAKNPTQVVVGATLKAGDETLKLVKYLGKLYTEEGFATEAINVLAHKYYVAKTEGEGETAVTTYTSVGANDITVSYVDEGDLESYQALAKVEKADADAKFYVKSGNEYVEADADELAADLKDYVVQRWKDGMTYYYVAIQHDADRTGVIRNHVYKLTVKSINGLGTPVPFSDTDKIIPEIPDEKESYISAEIDILAWKVVEQDVDLGK